MTHTEKGMNDKTNNYIGDLKKVVRSVQIQCKSSLNQKTER